MVLNLFTGISKWKNGISETKVDIFFDRNLLKKAHPTLT